MVANVFLNMAVKDLDKAKDFFGQLGFGFNQQFTDETAACLVLGPNCFVMLLKEDKMNQFTPKELADPTAYTETITAISLEHKEEVDQLMEKVLAAGGKEYREAEDHGFMYSRSFADIDGHLWEIIWLENR